MVNRGKRKEVCFHEDEWQIIERKAKETNLDTTNYIKRMALHGFIIEYDLNVLNDFIYELNKIGVNINQIARKVNETDHIHSSEIESIQEDMEQIWKAIKKSLGLI